MDDTTRPVGGSARFFEDFAIGETIVTQGRTITETDGSLWAMFTGDMNPMHVDDDYAARYGVFGGRFPPGLMAVAIASGLKERLGLFTGTGLAMLEQTIRYHSPVLFGDTIRVTLTVDQLTRHPGKRRGVVDFSYELHKEVDTLALDGLWRMLITARDD